MDPKRWQKLKNYLWLAFFAGIFCLMVYGLFRIAAAFAQVVLEIN